MKKFLSNEKGSNIGLAFSSPPPHSFIELKFQELALDYGNSNNTFGCFNPNHKIVWFFSVVMRNFSGIFYHFLAEKNNIEGYNLLNVVRHLSE